MAFYAGKTGYISIAPSIGGTLVRQTLEEWSLELEVEEVELTNFESAGFKSVIGGMRGGTVSGSGVYNGVIPIIQFQAGTIVDIQLGLLKYVASPSVSGAAFTVQALLTGVTFGMNVKEKATFEFSATLTNVDAAGAISTSQNQSIAQTAITS